MGLLNVEPAGLQALAKHCHGWSGDVAVTAAPAVPVASPQATATAVSAVHAVAGSAGDVLATRMSASGGHLSTTAKEMSVQDECGAQDLKGVAITSAADGN